MPLINLIPVAIEIYNAFTNEPEQVETQGVKLTDGYTYFNVDHQYRKNPDGQIEVYYPTQNRWAVYTQESGSISPTPSEEPINTGAYSPLDVNAAINGGTGLAPTSEIDHAIKIAISIANNNLYGYNWNSGNYANYQGRCGGWYAYLHNEAVDNGTATGYVAGDFDCSSFVAFVLWYVGIFPGSMSNWFNTVTDNLDARLRNNGFTRYAISSTQGLQMQRGDVLLRQSGSRANGTYSGHTAFCIGSGEIVHAKNNAFGDLSDTVLQNKYKERGDYLGHELCTQPDSIGNWQYLYRWSS